LDQAIQLDPKYARVYNNRGEVYEAMNDPGGGSLISTRR
jgi:hypothetical protein